MTPQRQAPRIAVLGGGIAGLACAHALLVDRPDLDVTVYEGSSAVGGKLSLGEVAGVPVDLGAEAMLSRRTEGTSLAEAVGLGGSVVHPSVSGAGVWTRGAVRPLPPTFMGIPTDLSMTARGGILSQMGTARAAIERWFPRLELTDDVAVGQLVADRLGREVRDRLVEPLLGGVYAGRADEISLHAALPQLVRAVGEHGGLLAAARALSVGPDRSADGLAAPRPVFAGIRGGMGRLPQAVAQEICRRGGSVVLDARVRELSRTEPGWRLRFGATDRELTGVADAVVVATPATPASRLLRDAAPAAARELARIDYASIALVTLAWPVDQMQTGLHGTGFLVPPVDGHLVKAATYSSRKWSWLSGDVFVVRCSIGRHRDEGALQRDDHELVEAVRADLHAATGLGAPLLDSDVTRWGGALPQYAVGHLDRVRAIRSALEDAPGLEVCGAAYDGVGIPAVVAGAREAATRVLTALDGVATMGA